MIRFIYKIKKYKRSYTNRNDRPIDILNYIKRIDSFPNVFIAYRKMLTILVSIAS